MNAPEWPAAVPRDKLTQRLQASLGKQLRLERELGGGGSARVFVANDHALGRQVVVKAVAASWASESLAERFAREIRVLARLQHPHIVPLLAAGGEAGLVWYSTPFVTGRSLRQRLDDSGPLAVREAIPLLRDVARGLAAAHRAGVIHRDIKPDNVVVSDGIALLIDFGLARGVEAANGGDVAAKADAARLTRPAHIVGTLPYLAPEQFNGVALPQTDLYAFGCTAFELLAGSPPFACSTPSAAMAAHLFERPPLLGERCPAAPDALVTLVARCLAKEPAERPASADEIVESLETTLAELVVPRSAPSAGDGDDARARSGAMPASGAPRGADATPPVLLVLPFDIGAGAGPDSEAAALADGFTEELITTMGLRGGVRVIARAVTASLRGRRDDPRELAGRLQATALVTGSVRTAGNRVRISVELADPTLGTQRWTARYDRPLDDLFAVQDDVAREITNALTLALGQLETADVGGREGAPIVGAEAVRAWLAGRQHRRLRPEAFDDALTCFDDALRRAPVFARAHAARAEVLLAAAIARLDASLDAFASPTEQDTPLRLFERAEEAARAALAADPRQLEARAILGACALAARWNWPEARTLLGHVLARDPRHPIAAPFALLMEVASGRRDAASAIFADSDLERASWYLATVLSLVSDLAGLDDGTPPEAATTDDGTTPSVATTHLALMARHAMWLQRAGRTAEAAALRESLRARVAEGVGPVIEWARCLAEAGELQAAEAALEAAAARRDVGVLLLGVAPALEELRTRPRVGALVHAIWGGPPGGTA
jgi:TolB-like protein/tRNA A-37 threonylcarbamoyl transferase component Bud32/tetratricopeptide (TPR) repeat protein